MRCVFLHFLLTMAALGAVRAQPVLTLEAATDRGVYYAETRAAAYIQAKVLAAGGPAAAGGGVRNIAFVLDRSGSMAGERMQALRQAVSFALESLEDSDVVSLVLFGSEVETLLPAQRRDQSGAVDDLLARIEPAGGAALYDALNQGAAQLRRYASSCALNHLVLVTDGPATKGPREHDDFARLAELFAREGFSLSTFGLGDDFGEDLLADLARIGNGRFRYLPDGAKLGEVLQAELAPLRQPVAREVVLRLEFGYNAREVESAGWEPAAIEDRVVTYRFPVLFAGQSVDVLAGGKFEPRRDTTEIATVTLQWKDAATGLSHEEVRKLSAYFESDTWVVRKSVNPGVMRAAVGAMISEGMQKAIEQLDKGDYRRALRALRKARENAHAMNYDLEDAQIAEQIRQLEAYLAEVQARGLNQLDRKILRSGLFNQFESPTKEPTAE